ncbi:MAG: hypothetical protein U1F59_07225 [Candidatus Competibacteraceae bacterium]
MLFVIDGQATIALHAAKQLMSFQNSQHFLAFGFRGYGHFVNGFRQYLGDQLRQRFIQVFLQFYKPFGINIIQFSFNMHGVLTLSWVFNSYLGALSTLQSKNGILSFLLPSRIPPHPVFDVVVDDEIQFFVGEAVVLG